VGTARTAGGKVRNGQPSLGRSEGHPTKGKGGKYSGLAFKEGCGVWKKGGEEKK